MFKQSFKNMGCCWLMSDIVKNSFFLFKEKERHHIMNTKQMFCSPFLLGRIQYIAILSSRKLANVMEVSGQVFELWCAWMDDDAGKLVSGRRRKRSVSILCIF